MNQPPASSPQAAPAWPFILPLAVYLVVGFFQPSWDAEGNTGVGLFLTVYALGLGLTVAAVVAGRRYIASQFPWTGVTWLAVIVGIGGAAVWIGLCQSGWMESLWAIVGIDAAALGARSHFDPTTIEGDSMRLGVIALRLLGLVLVVPLAEELFVRGWLVRFCERSDFATVSLDRIRGWRLLVPSIYGALTHPLSESLAAVVWFGLVTWLMVRTGRFWDCVAAHALTNLALGIYVLAAGQWHLW
jgi:CAAX prenyl protease-like protein